MKFVSLDNVKKSLDLSDAQFDNDDVLNRMIESTTKRFQTYMGRDLAIGSHTEYFNGGSDVFVLKNMPVTVVTSIHHSLDMPRVYDASTLVDSDDYDLTQSNGFLTMLTGELSSGFKSVQILYDGGYAVSNSNIIAVPDPLKQATLDQMMFFFQRRKSIGQTTQTFGDGSTTSDQQWDLLPGVKKVLNNYRIWALG